MRATIGFALVLEASRWNASVPQSEPLMIYCVTMDHTGRLGYALLVVLLLALRYPEHCARN